MADSSDDTKEGPEDGAGRNDQVVLPSVPITQITAGGWHNCALRYTGRVICWGSNQSGQIGTGDFSSLEPPTEVRGLSDVVHISAGGFHTCAVTEAGAVWCWGFNTSGQLGDASFDNSPSPVLVNGVAGAKTVALSNQATCALVTGGEVLCWGQNAVGELGNGSFAVNYPQPTTPVVDLDDAVQITGGNQFFCARRETGRIACWGSNSRGQLGDPSQIGPATTPVQVVQINQVADVAAGNTHACATSTTGKVACWGDNSYGELGSNPSSTIQPQPQEVSGLSDVAQVIAGDEHTCARQTSGSAYCWGINALGNLGAGDDHGEFVAVPTPVAGLTDAVQLSSHREHTCALLQAGGVVCWGSNAGRQISSSDTGSSNIPLAQAGL